MPDKQAKNKVDFIAPFMWKKGQSGNPTGRPKGKTMKEYARELLACQSEEERQEFLEGLDKETIWKMAEGNPTSDAKVDAVVKIIIAHEDDSDTSADKDTEGSTQV